MKNIYLIYFLILIISIKLQQIYIRANNVQSLTAMVVEKTHGSHTHLDDLRENFCSDDASVSTYIDTSSAKIGKNTTLITSREEYSSDKQFFSEKGLKFQLKRYYCIALVSIDVWKDKVGEFRVQSLGKVTMSFDQLFYPSVSNIIKGLVLGTQALYNDSNKHLFEVTGTQHILSISGFHLSFFAHLLNSFLSKFFSKLVSIILSLVLVTLYVCMVGISPGIFRAFSMYCLSVVATLYKRQINSLYLLLFTLVIAFLVDIQILFSIGFQLSFGATLGILLFFSRLGSGASVSDSIFLMLPRHGKKVLEYVIISTVVSFSAQIAIFPLLLYHFGTLNLVSIVATVLVTWIVPLLLSFGVWFSILQFFIPIKLLIIAFLPIHIFSSLMILTLKLVSFDNFTLTFENFSLSHLFLTYSFIFLIYWLVFTIKQRKSLRKHYEVYHFNY